MPKASSGLSSVGHQPTKATPLRGCSEPAAVGAPQCWWASGVKAPSRAGFQRTLGARTEDAATSEKNMTVDIREESIGHLDQLAAISTALWFMNNRTGDPSFASTQNSNDEHSRSLVQRPMYPSPYREDGEE